ncbi:uncharacterized protein [Montipora foliosa]|uniref:uncharacterized protein n=1 Tax=Montipora foliosa TaxID=591990 RepID=UPI0035F201C2
MTEMFEDTKKCEVIVDDLLVWGKNVEEHDLTLEKALQRAEETDLRFNEEKFMGMVNYLHKFISHLADINKPLRELLDKSVEWHRMERQQKAYEELINSITQAPVLKYFDVSADVTCSLGGCVFGGSGCLFTTRNAANTLRASQSESTLSTEEFEVHLLIQISKEKADEWKIETDSDPVLSGLREPFGVEKCLNRARETVYWPGVCEQIEEKVAKCEICNKYRNCQIKEPLLRHPVPHRPWQVLAADLFVLPQGNFVVLVDYYSEYFELTQLKDSTSATLINCLQQRMSRNGIPEFLYSDNGPEFSRLEFRQFAKGYQFQHVTSSPRFPQSNGLAKRTVQTAKKLLKKAYEDKKDPYLAILELRNTPIPGIMNTERYSQDTRNLTLRASRLSRQCPKGAATFSWKISSAVMMI